MRRSLAALLAVLLVLPTTATAAGAAGLPGCTRTADPAWSVARLWDEIALDGIRRALPAPTIHARNLFHLSVALWDAWAAYDPVADGWLVTEKVEADPADRAAAREEAMSYAAYRLLRHRYAFAVGNEETIPEIDAALASLCYDAAVETTEGSTPAALGNRIAAALIAFGMTDGANEETGYTDPTYEPVNRPLIVKRPGARLRNPDRWQPLALDEQVSQNGIPIPGDVQVFIGSQWGAVTPFALPPAGPERDALVPPPPARFARPAERAAYREAAVEMVRRSSLLDPADGVMIDISPASVGNDPLGTYGGRGRALNPETGAPYAPVMEAQGDWTRALAEYWADGPRSETPPGHWNTIANAVADTPGFRHRIGGRGPELDRLEYDTKLYLALNGALHDAAILAWGTKRTVDSVRPISMVRWLAGNGQSTFRDLSGYSPKGIPLVPGLIERITRKSSAPGERHAALRRHVGKIAVRAWRGAPADPETESSGVGWILGSRWTPYAEATFVTPSFAGFISGHSTFSRAGAEVLSALTGSPFFPGGLRAWTIPVDGLRIEAGPAAPVRIQAATYYDAADLAGISRLYSGFHIPADDQAGRVAGARVGLGAWSHVRQYFDGSARP